MNTPRLAPARALSRATFRSYRNSLRQAHARNPPLTATIVLVVAIALLALAAFQLQAVLPFISDQSLGSLTESQITDVGRASLTGLAAASWGLALLIETLGLQSAGLTALATVRGVGPVNRALGQLGPTVVCAGAFALVLVGPSSFAALYRSLLFRGAAAAPAAAMAAIVLVAVPLTAALTALTLQSACSVLLRRDRHSPELKATAAAISGGLLIGGIGLVLGGRTLGLFLLAPPTLVAGGLPHTFTAAAAVLLTSGVWAALCVLGNAVRPSIALRAGGVRWTLTWLRLPNPLATLEWRQMLRDPTYLTSTAVSVSGAAAMGLLYWRSTLSYAPASLLLMGLVGLTSLASCLAATRAATLAWIFRTRVGASLAWYLGALPGVLATMVSGLVVCRVLTGLPFSLAADWFLLTVGVCGAVIGLVAGIITNGLGTSTEHKLGLYGSIGLSTAALGLSIWPTTHFAAFDSSLVSGSYLLLVAIATAVAGYLLLVWRFRAGGVGRAVD